ncbi:MAG TPA: serine hydrolase domain-containing protein [Pyrinomonadaceae bacterium]|nr:serine hydrolase domain-containing protein [Pyrinomonadaceae bacterium]
MKTPAEKAAAMDALFSEYSQPEAPGASVIVIDNGKVLFKKAYGLANIESKIAATPNTNYRLASVSKQFTAMAIMILADRKKLSYDDNLASFFPGFPEYGKQITVRHLLNHSSGIIAYEDVMDDNATVPLTDQDVLELMKGQDHTNFPPGSAYRYSNSGYVLLGLIVEKVSGISFPEFLRQNIFLPLQMNHTVFYGREDRSDESHRAYGYSQRGEAFVRTDQSLTSSTRGDGAVYSSVSDLYKWDQGLHRSRLVKRQTLQQAFTSGIQVDEDTGYGFGWFIEKRHGLRTVWHSGNTIGCTQFIRRYLDRKLTIIVQANRNDAQLGPLAEKIEELYLEPK